MYTYEELKAFVEHGVFLERKNTWLTAVYHPSAVLRDETKLPQMQDDFRKIRKKLEEVEGEEEKNCGNF